MAVLNTDLKLILNINKPIGITSFDVIRQLKKVYPKNKIGHAGTLDPLADGILICLVGKSATAKQDTFMSQDKDYVYTVLFGIDTDTYDILGKIIKAKVYNTSEIQDKIYNMIPGLQGTFEQGTPPFSAAKIDGKPLYRWYLDGNFDQIVDRVPKRKIKVDNHNILSCKLLNKEQLAEKVFKLLNTVKGGFRQQEIITEWHEFFKQSSQSTFLIVKLKATVSKGAYVRGIAKYLGDELGIGACTINITRTRVGDFNIDDSIRLEELPIK